MWVDHDNLVELVSSIFTNPVGIEDLEVGEVAVDTLFCDSLDVLGHGDLAHTHVPRLTLHVDLALSQSTTADSGTDDDYTLLGLVAEATCSV